MSKTENGINEPFTVHDCTEIMWMLCRYRMRESVSLWKLLNIYQILLQRWWLNIMSYAEMVDVFAWPFNLCEDDHFEFIFHLFTIKSFASIHFIETLNVMGLDEFSVRGREKVQYSTASIPMAQFISCIHILSTADAHTRIWMFNHSQKHQIQ